ncbi:MAG: hypothetical protein M3229_03280 [Actinomycetota bacterium]|nr:hypothetical protein [Actinomycetota bacterium]
MRRWRRPFRRDPLRARIGEHGKLPLRLYKQLDRDIRFPFDPIGWWTTVGLRSAAAGAAVMLAEYRTLVQSADSEAGEPDRRFAAAASDVRAMRRAYRVVACAYMCEITLEVWPSHHEHEIDEAAAALLALSRYEAQLRSEARGVPGPADFRRKVFTAMMATAAGGEDPLDALPDDPPTRAWSDCYVAGRELAGARLKELSFSAGPPLVAP